MSMNMVRKRTPRGNQEGFALLVALLVLVVGAATFFLGTRTATPEQSIRDVQRSAVILDNAASALQVYSMSDKDRPGSLPCPDFTGDGTSDINCLSAPGVVYVERLPWKTIDITRDTAGLWYAMDSDFRDNTTAEPINVEVEGSIVLDGTPGYAALIIDPGDPLKGQSNRGSADEDIKDYLDIDENTDGDSEFLDCRDRTNCNDRMIGVSVIELFDLVQRKVLDSMKNPLNQFIDESVSEQGYLPFAARLGSSECESDLNRGHIPLEQGGCTSNKFIDRNNFPEWIVNNEWLEIAIYHVDENCTAAPCNNGQLVVDETENLTLVIALPGGVFDYQNRSDPPLEIDDYLESGIDDGAYNTANDPKTNNDWYWGATP